MRNCFLFFLSLVSSVPEVFYKLFHQTSLTQCTFYEDQSFNSIVEYLAAPRPPPGCSSKGSTTTTIITPTGLHNHLKEASKTKCTLVMFFSSSCHFR
ncbi:Oidioi.mRNA.OKI2018_I69.chr2.g6496.t1.cds [Oikopleura dioica]|uniref:Oidioi.mRNA.OKI2018_I69.chr2.g6496.t1.cds n=1 Tax=Oikopleura dioica TaxID=34765 RepID=A0ABN7TA57_OIKDI|nr:Oidioi.mRNA.OKI2018_I69.chr2.g6496.t1.cds [Oikopleura dioica]